MEWSLGEKLSDEKLIEKYEAKIEYHYPKQLIEIVREYDGGSPEFMEFDTQQTKGRVFEYLLCFSETDPCSVWDNVTDGQAWTIDGLDWRYIPFGIDPFGNFICFDRTNDHVVFWDHETGEIEEVADTFTEFINSLYESDD